MIRVQLVIFFLISNNLAYSQNKALHFISANPGFAYADKMIFYKSLLYQLDETGDSLKVLDTLSSRARTETTYLKIYHEYDKVFLHEQIFATDSSIFTILDFSKKPQVKRITLTYSIPYYASNFLDIPAEGQFFVIGQELHSGSNEIVYWGADTALNIKEIDPLYFKNAVVGGASGTAIEGSDYLIVYTDQKNGSLKIPVTRGINDRPGFPLVLPPEFQIGESLRRPIFINDSSLFTVRTEYTNYTNSEIGYSTLVIFDKALKKWFKYKIKGNNTKINHFDSWISGFVAGHYETYKTSPGKDTRPQKVSYLGNPFDNRALNMELYCPGILYLINVQSQNYIEWDTGQGDSEILLVAKDTVYYRINDSIYKAPIIKNERLGEAVLLVQDEKVPYIHWAFISETE